jgi:hypothetical protein
MEAELTLCRFDKTSFENEIKEQWVVLPDFRQDLCLDIRQIVSQIGAAKTAAQPRERIIRFVDQARMPLDTADEGCKNRLLICGVIHTRCFGRTEEPAGVAPILPI